MNTSWKKFPVNPFIRIAGWQALGYGLAGIIVATLLSWLAGYHYHGLLHFGPAPNPAWWCFAIEHLTVWIVPSLLFYFGGLIFSKSRIRIADVFGTVAFAQIPFIFMTLFAFLPPVKRIYDIDINLPPVQMLSQPGFMTGLWLTVLSSVFLIWVLIWMFRALNVSCNLKGWRLWTVYLVAVFGGDAICRLLIGLCYT